MKKLVAIILVLSLMTILLTACGEDRAVSKILINEKFVSIAKGSKQPLLYSIEPLNAQNDGIIWKSDNKDVATVKGGVISGKNVGSAIITAQSKDGGYRESVDVQVREDVLVVSDTYDQSTTGYNLYKFSSITSAMAMATTDDVIMVLGGTYDESVPITKNITLKGEDVTVTGYFLIGIPSMDKGVTDVTIEGFDFVCPEITSLKNPSSIYIGSNSSGVVIKNCTFSGSENSDYSGIQTDVTATSTALSNIKIIQNTFSNLNYGIDFEPLVTKSIISDNVFLNVKYAINVLGGQKMTIENNDFEKSGVLKLEKGLLTPADIIFKHNEIQSVYQVGDKEGFLFEAQGDNLEKKELIDLRNNLFFGIDPNDMTENQRNALLNYIDVGGDSQSNGNYSHFVLTDKEKIFSIFK